MSAALRPLAAGGYWASQALQGKGAIRHRLAALEESQHRSAEQIRAEQMAKLQRLVAHCYQTVAYYREVMDARGIAPRDVVDADTYAALPLLTRDLLRDRQADLVSRSVDVRTLQTRRSSGSTGVRVEVQQDRDFDLWCRAHQLRTYGWCGGWRLGDPFALVWGSPVHFETRSRRSDLDNRISRRVELNAFRLDRPRVDAILDALVRARPRLISGYTTALYLVAQRALERGVELAHLRAVQPNAEPLPRTMRATIEAGFGCPAWDKYGSRESSIVAHESPSHDGMCIQAEHTYVEFLDEDGRACAPGQPGRLVLTTLNNRAQPLLRYATSDVAAPLEGECRSGVALPRMTAVTGRLHDMLCTPDGGLVHPQLFSNVMRQLPHVQWFQVVQTEEARLTLRVVVPGGELPATDRTLITGLIAQHAGFPFAVEFDLLDDMPDASTATGKFRVCVCDIPARDGALAALNAIRSGEDDGAPQSRPHVPLDDPTNGTPIEVDREYVTTAALFKADTALGWARQAQRRVLRGRRSAPGGRYVDIRDRLWATDLGVSRQLKGAIQGSKKNVASADRPPVHWKGVLHMKDPFSLATYPLLLQELRPRTIVEIGSYHGGSALWLADLLETFGLGDARIVSYDVDVDDITVDNPRIAFHQADSRRPETFAADRLAALEHPWLLIEDAHVNVHAVLTYFDRFLARDDYVVVEDTQWPEFYPDLRRFLRERDGQYLVDTRYTDLFGYNVTWHVNGYLRKMHD